MAIKKSELYSSLWKSCDKLRGGMDASQYKDYILTLLFIKYVSDKYKGVKYPEIDVPEGGSFDDIVALKGKDNIGEGMDIIIAKLAEANELKNIIDNAKFNDDTKLGKGKEQVDKLTDLVSIFQRPELDFSRNRAEGDDIIGDAYEYLMRNFATESGKSKGQFYTPAEVSRIIASVIGIDSISNPETTLYDPACGSGSLLIRAADAAPIKTISIYGQEKDLATAGMAKMNFVLHNKADAEIAGNMNTFADPFFKDKNNPEKLQQFDFVVANPPFSIKNWTDGIAGKEYGRFTDYGAVPPEKNGDYAWLLHIIKSMKPSGKGACILPHGVLFRGNAEADIRTSLITRGYIKTIIGLPANLFYGTGIPACILILDKEGAGSREGIFMIDASRGFVKDGNKNRLRERDIYKIVSAFREWRDEDKYSRFVPLTEIKANDYNLNIPRYIDSSEPDDLQNIDGHLNGGIPATDVDSLQKYWELFPKLKNVLFAPLRKGYYSPKLPKDEIAHAIYADKEFAAYCEHIDAATEAWKSAVLERFTGITAETDIHEFITKLADEILQQFETVTLLDKYDVYQVLLSYWQDVMADDTYIIKADGYKAARDTVAIMGEYTSGKKKGQEKVIGHEGKLIPRQIIRDYYFCSEQKAIADTEDVIAGKENELAELIESNEDEDDIDEKAAAELKNKIREYSKLLKDMRAELEAKELAKYPILTDDEIIELLVNQKWYGAMVTGIEQLYRAVSHNIAARVTELAERYERTLRELESKAHDYGARVEGHLKRMGFSW
ncbi:MAG: type I restriction-modification system subunit M [Termitinemataceae bacterium]|nr:MAG: type I restriction-modification system subunit M [Termitinemataceae bacterium]